MDSICFTNIDHGIEMLHALGYYLLHNSLSPAHRGPTSVLVHVLLVSYVPHCIGTANFCVVCKCSILQAMQLRI